MNEKLPELGNLMWGHSFGEWRVPRSFEYEDPLSLLIQVIQRADGQHGYSAEYSNGVFEMHNYWWGDEEDPLADRPNFKHKASGLELRWYKYPLRDSYMSEEVSPSQWAKICAECADSVTGKSCTE